MYMYIIPAKRFSAGLSDVHIRIFIVLVQLVLVPKLLDYYTLLNMARRVQKVYFNWFNECFPLINC